MSASLQPLSWDLHQVQAGSAMLLLPPRLPRPLAIVVFDPLMTHYEWVYRTQMGNFAGMVIINHSATHVVMADGK